mmetsp:Transcript_44330/g.48034  ORF Transcript_44330/g.48034 Transcript_44330/m.48034 type:complete len:82 (+) Transcript_44330:156-401(+)
MALVTTSFGSMHSIWCHIVTATTVFVDEYFCGYFCFSHPYDDIEQEHPSMTQCFDLQNDPPLNDGEVKVKCTIVTRSNPDH